MSYGLSLYSAIYTRLTGDATLVAACPATRISWYSAQPGAVYPHITMNVVAAAQEDAMRTRSVDVEFDVHVWNSEEPNSGTEGFTTAHTILQRVRGDWDAQTYGTAPTYGLDHFTPSTAGGYTFGPIRSRSSTEQHEPGILHFVQSYVLPVHRPGA